MKILIAGATGKTGLRLVNELKTRGHEPVALVRGSSDTSTLPADVEVRQGDLADLDGDVCKSCDVVIFAAGSGGATGPDMTDKIDRDGAKRLIDLAAKSQVSRFVMLSTVGADNPDPDSRCCQTNANQSLQGQRSCSLCRAETAPIGKSGGAVQLEI